MQHKNFSISNSFQDPCIALYSISFSMGDTLQTNSVKSPWKTTLRKIGSFRTILHSEFWTHFKTPVDHTSHSVNGPLSRPFRRGIEQQITLEFDH